jgi:hypothetical protein
LPDFGHRWEYPTGRNPRWSGLILALPSHLNPRAPVLFISEMVRLILSL